MNMCVILFCLSVILLYFFCVYLYNYKCFFKCFNVFILMCVLVDCYVYLIIVDFVFLV